MKKLFIFLITACTSALFAESINERIQKVAMATCNVQTEDAARAMLRTNGSTDEKCNLFFNFLRFLDVKSNKMEKAVSYALELETDLRSTIIVKIHNKFDEEINEYFSELENVIKADEARRNAIAMLKVLDQLVNIQPSDDEETTQNNHHTTHGTH